MSKSAIFKKKKNVTKGNLALLWPLATKEGRELY